MRKYDVDRPDIPCYNGLVTVKNSQFMRAKRFLSSPVRVSAVSVYRLGVAALAAAFVVALPWSHPRARPAALQLRAQPPRAPQFGADLPNPDVPLLVVHGRQRGVPFILIQGGVVGTRRAAERAGVETMVREAGAQAGLNGTFFSDASLRGTDSVLIGPAMYGGAHGPEFQPSQTVNTLALAGRPLVLLAPNRTRILPYNPPAMNTRPAMDGWLPGLTDAFLGGVWLVHNNVAADRVHIDAFHIRDAEDPRRRSFFCLMPDGRPCLGATTYVAQSDELARALQSAGIREAVLLDSGFSTSLVYGRKVLVTGHTSPGIPSRPVPHALVLFGTAAVKKAKTLIARAPLTRASAAHAPAAM